MFCRAVGAHRHHDQATRLRTRLEPIIISHRNERSRYRNWARSYGSTPATAFEPTTEDQCTEILELARLEGRVVRAVGCGHSPNDLPCTTGFMIRMDKLDQLIEVSTQHFPSLQFAAQSRTFGIAPRNVRLIFFFHPL
jgi:FAD/FMN-containing dehydrogenase